MTQELQNKKIGYYQNDSKIIDYNIVFLHETNLWVRSPVPYSLGEDSFFCCIGAAQTFGRFVKKPYPKIISEHLTLPVLNLGRGGTGPSYFSQQKKVIDVINKAKFVIVQIMSGRSINNSLFNDPDNLNQFFTPFTGNKRVLSGKVWEFFLNKFYKKLVLSFL